MKKKEVDAEAVPSATRQVTQADLRWLVCPLCRESLDLKPTAAGNLHHIVCSGCKSDFPVVDGLPILLAKKAERSAGTLQMSPIP